MGHVNNAKYLTFAQEARFEWSFVQNAEGNNRPGFLQMVVAKAEVDFLAPIFDGGIFVDVELWVESVGNSSFSMVYEIKDEKKTYARVLQSMKVLQNLAHSMTRKGLSCSNI
jgi:acyl-CoA thioester hydrolase